MRMRWLLLLLLPSVCVAQIHVSLSGSDNNPGTKERPFATVHRALRQARELRRLRDTAAAKDIEILVGPGRYAFDEPLFIRPEDSGTPSSRTVIRAAGSEQPVFSGGRNVQGWKPAPAVAGLPSAATGKVWVADLSTMAYPGFLFRQFWVRGRKAIRARQFNGETMGRILAWNKSDGTCLVPKTGVPLNDLYGLEFFIHQWWAIAQLRVAAVEPRGDSLLLRFRQPEARIQNEHPWPAPWISKETGNSAFTLTNHLSFLDEPGEWYYDDRSHLLYYWPRNDENLNTDEAVVPLLEELVRIEGAPDHPVSHVRIQDIVFAHTTWTRPSRQGHVALQNGLYFLDAYSLKKPGTTEKPTLENQAWLGRPSAAVTLQHARALEIFHCGFHHLGSTALDLRKGVASLVTDNTFRDIGGNGILAGVFSDEPMEAHRAYRPANQQEPTEAMIAGNLLTDIANEDWGCVGIGAGFVRNTVIRQNDLSELPYSGIALGWGWTPQPSIMRNNRVEKNRIVRFGRQMYDVAGIYTLSAQPGSYIQDNYIDSVYQAPYAHLPSHWFYLYTDEGSSGITVANNWTPSAKYLQNANGPGNAWRNNGPQVYEGVRRKAGLSERSETILEDHAPAAAIPVTHEFPVVIELVAPNGQTVPEATVRSILAKNGISSTQLYTWKEHLFVFGNVPDAGVLRSKLQSALPALNSKVYYTPFYEFNRESCTDTATARETNDYLFTANLVADEKLQSEYLNYHAVQASEWPEIARGFCHAAFQQLLVYVSALLLFLLIRVPKVKTLDELHQNTTEDNPRVTEWNRIMAKYQEGIEGTRPGEVWVPLMRMENKNTKTNR